MSAKVDKMTSTKDGGVSKSGRKRTKKTFEGYEVSDLAKHDSNEEASECISNVTSVKNKTPGKDGKRNKKSVCVTPEEDDVTAPAELDETPPKKKSRKSKKSSPEVSTVDLDTTEVNTENNIQNDNEISETTEPTKTTKTKKSRKNKKSTENTLIPDSPESVANITTTQTNTDTTNTNVASSSTTQEDKTETNTPAKTKAKKKKWKTLDESNKTTLSELREIKQDSALNYLKQWYKQKQEWNFKKRHQIWLLQNAYKDDKITDKMFAILLKYLEKLQGGARQRITEEAVAIIEDDSADQTAETEKKSVRAREILYAIQDS